MTAPTTMNSSLRSEVTLLSSQYTFWTLRCDSFHEVGGNSSTLAQSICLISPYSISSAGWNQTTVPTYSTVRPSSTVMTMSS